MSRRNATRLWPVLAAASTLLALGLSATAEAAKPKPVYVFPSPKTQVASDQTTFSFRGLKPGNLGKIRVVGSESGVHGGRRLKHSDGRGVSFVPKKPFTPGEKVRVYTSKRIRLANHGDFWVRIGRFYGSDDTKAGPGTPLPKDGLHSRPDLKPPVLKVLTSTPQAAPGKIFFAPKQDGMTIADNAGRISWYRPVGFGGTGNQVLNFHEQTYQGKPVLTYWKGASSASGFSQIGTYEILNDHYHVIKRFQPGNGYGADIHEFTLTPRNTALVLSYRGVKENLSKYGGPADGKLLDNVVQEIDLKSGAVLFEWHSVGNVGVGASTASPDDDGTSYDYIHVNAIKTDGDSFLVSGRKTSTIYRIDRKTGRIKWRLRGDGAKPVTNDYTLGDGTTFAYQHDIERLPNGDISLFDNGSGRGVPPVNPESSAVVLHLSGKGSKDRTASLVARYRHTPDPIVSGSQGNADLQDNGNFFVGWGDQSQMTEFTPDGTIAFDATFKDSAISSYRAFKAPWEGHPNDRPAIASEAAGSGATVWASWNGATVDHWKVFTGSTGNDLAEAGSSPWMDLETTIPVETAGARVKVVAYDRSGRKIGESALVPLGTQSR